MKKTIALIMTGLTALTLAACGSQTQAPEEPAAREAPAEAASTEASEEVVGLANPWTDITEEEAYQLVANGFSAPEGATNVVWSKMVSPENESRPLVQMTFDLDGMSFTARQQTTGDTPEDISGMYYDWTVEDDVTLANWADGNMPAQCKRYIGENETADLCTWYDIELGDSYSLSVTAPDLEGFDIQAIAEQIYDPAKQVGANMPDDEDAHIPMDITGCDTFTQIVDKLPAGWGYSNATVDGVDVLVVTENTFNNDPDGEQMAAIDADVYFYDNGAPAYAGYVTSGGTAYPLTVADGKLYTGGNHYVQCFSMIDFGLVIEEEAWVEYDTDGAATYYAHSDLHDMPGADENGQVEDDTKLNELFDKMLEGEVIVFDVVK